VPEDIELIVGEKLVTVEFDKGFPFDDDDKADEVDVAETVDVEF